MNDLTITEEIEKVRQHLTNVKEEQKKDKAYIAYLQGFIKGLQVKQENSI